MQNVQVASDIKVIAMKSSSFNLLAVSAAFFALCASAIAGGPTGDVPSHPISKPGIIQTRCLKCHGGASVNGDLDFRRALTREQKVDAISMVAQGEMPKSGPKLTPDQFSQLKKELAAIKTAGAPTASNGAPAASPVAKSPAPTSRSLKATTSGSSNAFTSSAPPQAHISTARSSDVVPTARVRVIPAGSPNSKPVSTSGMPLVEADKTPPVLVVPPKPVVKPQTAIANTLADDDFDNSLDTLSSLKDDSSKVSESTRSPKGDWVAVTRQGDGEPSTFELQQDDNGRVKLTGRK